MNNINVDALQISEVGASLESLKIGFWNLVC
jgi:hypothetical protein